MTVHVWPVAEIRAAEERLMATVPAGALMQRAAAGLARRCADLLEPVYGAVVVLLVGAGDNGGDALYAGARLARRGARVQALLMAPDKAHPGGLAALRAAGGRVSEVDLSVLEHADLVIDGIVGIGGRGPLRPPADEVVSAVPHDVARVAVDLPSGVDADTGEVHDPAFRADVTVTFGALKAGLVVSPGADLAGAVDLVDIGLSPYLPHTADGRPDARMWVIGPDEAEAPVPGPGDDKYSRGVVGVASGSAAYGGAAVLSVGGAIRGGAGMVRYVGAAADQVRARWPEAVVSEGRPGDAGRVQAWVVGPGLGTDAHAEGVVREVLGTDLPVLVDADGLTVVAKHRDWVADRAAETVLTPHDREFERIFGPVGKDRIGAVRRAMESLGGAATVLLKGNTTLVGGAGAVRINPTGTPWLATAGSGDVLSGLIGALLAAVPIGPQAAAAGAYLHGLAARRLADGAPMSAGQLVEALPDAIRTVHRLTGEG